MNKLALFALLVICGSVIADDCTALTTEATCTANTSCAYASTGGSCANKCDTLAKADCENATNSPSCDSTAASCGVVSDCTTNNSNETACKANAACGWTAQTGTCALKTTVLEDACKVKDETTCKADAKCAFTAAVFGSCTYKAGGCAAQTEANCDPNYCQNKFVCYSKSEAGGTACSTQNADATACNLLEGCSHNGTTCADTCATKVTTTCTDTNKCAIKTGYSCADLTSGDKCSTLDATTCPQKSTFCTVNNTTPAKCGAKSDYCSAMTPANCQADTTNCSFTQTAASACANTVSAATCGGKADADCTSANGCKLNAYKCSNKAAKKCLTTDTSTVCGGTDKYCTYTATGSCAAKSYSSIIAAGSLLVIAALL